MGHVLIKHGGGYDDLVEGLVVPPQGGVGGLLLATAAGRERESLSVMAQDTHTYVDLTLQCVWEKLDPDTL